jgi:hypothetical protein
VLSSAPPQAIGGYEVQFAHQSGKRVIVRVGKRNIANALGSGSDQVIGYRAGQFEDGAGRSMP